MKMPRLLFVVLAAAALAAAQEAPPPAVRGSELDAVALPGQFWSVNGTIEPVEKNNVYTENYVEQEAVVWSTAGRSLNLAPYAGLGFVFDTAGYDYNNKFDLSVGLRLNKYFRSGIISAGAAFADEDRMYGKTASGMTYYGQYWFGWQPMGVTKNRFPGSSWGVIGNISPIERGDYIFMDYATQSVVARRFGQAKTTALMPYSEVTFVRSTANFDWENKVIEGGGVKVGIPKGELYTELGVGYLFENRFNSGLSASQVKIFVNFSYAWNLFGRRAR